jgi:hypothetical protein
MRKEESLRRLDGWMTAKMSDEFDFYSSALRDACGENDTQMRDSTAIYDGL